MKNILKQLVITVCLLLFRLVLFSQTINPGGSNGQLQYNNNGVFGGIPLSWDSVNVKLTSSTLGLKIEQTGDQWGGSYLLLNNSWWNNGLMIGLGDNPSVGYTELGFVGPVNGNVAFFSYTQDPIYLNSHNQFWQGEMQLWPDDYLAAYFGVNYSGISSSHFRLDSLVGIGTRMLTVDSDGVVNASNLKTINGISLLGTGDISIKTVDTDLTLNGNINFPAFPYVNDTVNPSTTTGMINYGSESVLTIRADKTFSTGTGNNNGNGYTDIFLGRGFSNSVRQMTNGGGNIAIGDAFSNDTVSYPNNPSFSKVTKGYLNTMIGQGSFGQLTNGYYNISIGYNNLISDTSGYINTAIGCYSLKNNINGYKNIAIGNSGSRYNLVGRNNTAIGQSALYYSDSGSYNVGIGVAPLYYLKGNNQFNTAVGGWSALQNLVTGNYNTAIGGRSAGYNLTNGNYNTFIGSYSGEGATSASLNNSTAIGYLASVTTDNTIILGNSQINGVAFGNGLSTANAMLEVQNNNIDTMIVSFENSQGKKLFRVDSSGNIFANGIMTTKKVKVTQMGWADYVFNENYNVLPINQLDEYIKIHRHLPDVPTAQEIEKEGVDVAETQRVLLQKVEELTLYVIEQNKRIEKLEKENKHLKKQK